jgi:hypothetical protein
LRRKLRCAPIPGKSHAVLARPVSAFTHILGTFPLVEPGVKAAALEAFRAGG